MTTATFDYENLNPRSPTVVGRALRLIPGVRRVSAQTRPYAAWWRAQNLETLSASDGPVWAVLGDSMSQGIGASRVEYGWVPRVQAALRERGVNVRVLNLSFSGARTGEVTELQLPVLRETGLQPDAITVMIGSNDLVRRSLREELPDAYGTLLRQLPSGTLFATWPGGGLSPYRPLVEQARGIVPVRVRFASGGVAEDRYHPNDASYAEMARGFTGPMLRALGVDPG